MSHDYALSRVRDALEKSDGNHLKAQRLLMTWLEKDSSLLLGLAAPHIQGIVAHAISHVIQPPKVQGKKIDIDPDSTGEFGAALLESLKGGRNGGSSVGFGESERGLVSRPVKASQKHVEAIHKLAGKPPSKKDN